MPAHNSKTHVTIHVHMYAYMYIIPTKNNIMRITKFPKKKLRRGVEYKGKNVNKIITSTLN